MSLALLVLIIAVPLIIWQLDTIGQARKVDQQSQQYKSAADLVVNTLDPAEIKKGIPELEKILENPASIEIEANTRSILALALIYGENPDLKRGMEMLKATAVNESYPKVRRAVDVQHIVDVIGFYDKNALKEYVFVGAPFDSFYKEEKLGLAKRRLDEWADELWPIAVPNYRIALWYANQLLADKIKPRLSASKKTEYTNVLQQRLERADAIFATVPMEGRDSWDKDRLLLAYLTKAKILERLYIINGKADVADRNEADTYFNLALEVNDAVFVPKGYGVWPPFHYAAFLAETGAKNQVNVDKIKSLLAPLYAANRDKNERFFNRLKNVSDDPSDEQYLKQQVLLLVQIDPQFRGLLKELGWTEAQLNVKVEPL